MLSFLSGVLIPLITKGAQTIFDGKAKKDEAKAQADIIAAQANAQNAVELAKLQAQVALAQADVDKTAIVNRPPVSTNKIIVMAIDIIRVCFGVCAIGILAMAALHYFFPARFGNALTYPDFANAFFIILGFFFGERCVKKAWSN